MAEAAASELPASWQVILWSELLAKSRPGLSYENAADWARISAPRLLIDAEARHIQISGAFADIQLRAEAQEIALRQVAAYAHQGAILEQAIPYGILVQCETPPDQKAKLYQPLRQQPLPIIHPFQL